MSLTKSDTIFGKISNNKKVIECDDSDSCGSKEWMFFYIYNYNYSQQRATAHIKLEFEAVRTKVEALCAMLNPKSSKTISMS